MKAIRMLAIAVVFAIGSFVTTSAFAGAEYPECFGKVPLPETLDIVKPSAGTPEKFARWIGLWGGGSWEGKRCSGLVVLSVDDPKSVRLIYSFGAHVIRQGEPGFRKRIGTLSEDGEKLVFKLNDQTTVSYAMSSKDGKPYLKAEFASGGGWSNATFWRKE